MTEFKKALENQASKVITIPVDKLLLLVELDNLDAQKEVLDRGFMDVKQGKEDSSSFYWAMVEKIDKERRRLLSKLFGSEYEPEIPFEKDGVEQYLLRFYV